VKTQLSSKTLDGGNKEHVEKMCKEVKLSPKAVGLLLLLADVMDLIAKGNNTYVIFGSTQSRDAYSLSVRGDDQQPTIYGSNYDEISIKAFDMV